MYVGDEDVQEVKVGRMKRRVILMDTMEARQDILHEFAQRSKEFVKTSVEWAPDTVQSHLQEYINSGKTYSMLEKSEVNFKTVQILFPPIGKMNFEIL